jgi:hypothetical protein
MSLNGCVRYKVISSGQSETFVKQGETFTPPINGVFMSEERYQRIRRAIADTVMQEQLSATNR